MVLKITEGNLATVEFRRCDGCGRDGRFTMDGKVVFVSFLFSEIVFAYDLIAAQVPLEVAKRLREAVCNADFLAGYDPAARSPLWTTPGERRPFLEGD